MLHRKIYQKKAIHDFQYTNQFTGHGFSSVFFRYTWSDQNSSTKFQIVPGPGNWTKNFFLFFSLNIQYRARLKGPPFSFSALRDLFSKKTFPQRVPLQFFLQFCDRMDVEKSQRVPSVSFFGIVRPFFEKEISVKDLPSIFWCFATEWKEKSQSVPPGAQIRSNFWVFRVL